MVISQMEYDYNKKYTAFKELVRSRTRLEAEIKTTPSLKSTLDRVLDAEKKLHDNLIKMKQQLKTLAEKSDALMAQINALESLENSMGNLDFDFQSYDIEIESIIKAAEAELDFANELIKAEL